MKKRLLAIATCLLAAGPALAGGTHEGGHGGEAMKDHHSMAVGEPGDASEATRVIEVVMRETDDGAMVFEPASIEVRQGETIRFNLVNRGELEHEFVLDDMHGLMKHKALMEKFPEMEHADPNALRLAPAENGEIVWTFSNAGPFHFGCLIPGHYEVGMKGDLNVVQQPAIN